MVTVVVLCRLAERVYMDADTSLWSDGAGLEEAWKSNSSS